MRRAGIDVLAAVGVVPADAQLDIASNVCQLEGPAADLDGTLYLSDIPGNRILRRDPSGRLHVFRDDSGRANGNAFDLDGRLVTCEGGEHGPGGRRRITRTDLRTGEVDVVTDRFDGKRYNSPNDVVVDSLGRIFFTDPRYGADRSDLELDDEAVYRVDIDGSVHHLVGQPTIHRPNGLAVTPDARTLYVVDSDNSPGGNRKVWDFTLDAGGNVVGAPREVHDFAPGRGGDGLELDQEGNLYVCAGRATPRGPGETPDVAPGVYILRPDGECIGAILVPHDHITNCCFGGPDLRTLYITVSAMVYEVEVSTPGYHAYPVAVRE